MLLFGEVVDVVAAFSSLKLPLFDVLFNTMSTLISFSLSTFAAVVLSCWHNCNFFGVFFGDVISESIAILFISSKSLFVVVADSLLRVLLLFELRYSFIWFRLVFMDSLLLFMAPPLLPSFRINFLLFDGERQSLFNIEFVLS